MPGIASLEDDAFGILRNTMESIVGRGNLFFAAPPDSRKRNQRGIMNRINFPQTGDFYKVLKDRVNQYFRENRKPKTGNFFMYLKTAIIFAWLAGSYTFLVFFADSFLWAALGAVAMAQGFILVGFNIMHDANHGSYSQSKTINKILGWSLELIGGSSQMWKQKHNVLHHTYTNLDDLDDDIDTGGMLRLSPHQAWKPWHRFQRWYAFPLYSLLTIYWLSYTDFKKLITGRIGAHTMPETTVRDRLFFVGSKIFYFSYAVAVPLFFHSALHVLIAFLAIHMMTGLTLAVVFQLAHSITSSEYPLPDSASGQLPEDWAIHQIRTTADFAPGNPVATWYLGGLNYQIEHHLFSRISHVHYPAISKIVAQTCEDFSLKYNQFPTLGSALAGHWRFLGQMAVPPAGGGPASA